MFGKLLKMKVFTISPTSLIPQLGQAMVRPQHALRVHFVSSYYNNGCL